MRQKTMLPRYWVHKTRDREFLENWERVGNCVHALVIDIWTALKVQRLQLREVPQGS